MKVLRFEDRVWLKQQIRFKSHMIRQENPKVKDVFLAEVATLKGPCYGR